MGFFIIHIFTRDLLINQICIIIKLLIILILIFIIFLHHQLLIRIIFLEFLLLLIFFFSTFFGLFRLVFLHWLHFLLIYIRRSILSFNYLFIQLFISKFKDCIFLTPFLLFSFYWLCYWSWLTNLLFLFIYSCIYFRPILTLLHCIRSMPHMLTYLAWLLLSSLYDWRLIFIFGLKFLFFRGFILVFSLLLLLEGLGESTHKIFIPCGSPPIRTRPLFIISFRHVSLSFAIFPWPIHSGRF